MEKCGSGHDALLSRGVEKGVPMKNALKTTLGALALVAVSAVSAGAATLSGLFNVTVAQLTSQNSSQSEATLTNFNLANAGPVASSFTYDGALNFGTNNQNDSTTIASWLSTGGGTVTWIGTDIGGNQLSKDDINKGTATTTFFLFERILADATNFTIQHDDGIAVFDDGSRIGGRNGPTSQVTTNVNGFNGGKFGLLYVATNGDPSVLRVNATVVPLPAGGVLLLTAFAGLAALRRRKAA